MRPVTLKRFPSPAVIESDVNGNVLTFHNQQQRLNHLSLMSIESELSRKQNFWQAVAWICLQKNTKSAITVRELFHIPEFMINQTFSFSLCISTLFIWYCRVCYFVWWTRVLWGHRATLVFIEMMGAFEQLYLRTPKSLIRHWGNQHLCMQRQHSSLATSTLGNTPNLNIGFLHQKENPTLVHQTGTTIMWK